MSGNAAQRDDLRLGTLLVGRGEPMGHHPVPVSTIWQIFCDPNRTTIDVADDPLLRLGTAVDDNGWIDAWTAQDNNGQDH